MAAVTHWTVRSMGRDGGILGAVASLVIGAAGCADHSTTNTSTDAGCSSGLVDAGSEAPSDAALDTAVFAPRRPVRHVVVRGDCVVRDGQHGLATVAAEAFRRVLDRLAEAV